MPALQDWRRRACVCAFALSVAVNAPAQTFKIANWNIRSGKGIAALAGPRHFNSDTNNCTDKAYLPHLTKHFGEMYHLVHGLR